MSMSQDTENFEQLGRLLKLKRYEQPPPRFFNDFSDQVIARIKRGDRGEENGFIERLLSDAPWVYRIWTAFEARPGLVAAFGVAVCGLLITGAVLSEKTDIQPIALVPGTEAPADTTVEMAKAMAVDHPLLVRPAALEASSTTPIATPQLGGPLLEGLQARPVSFTFPGRN